MRRGKRKVGAAPAAERELGFEGAFDDGLNPSGRTCDRK